MRFAFVLTNLAGGGAEKAILNIANGLHARGHDIDLLLLAEDGAYHAPPELNPTPLTRRLQRGWLGKRLNAWRLRRHFSARPADVVISTLPFADEVCQRAGLTHHWCRIANTLSVEIARLAERSPEKAARRQRRYAACYATTSLIAVSQGVADDLRQHFGCTGALRTIANPFDIAAIRAAAAESAGPPLPEGPFVLHVGRFASQKRHDVLLKAWARLTTPHRLVLLTTPDPELTGLIEANRLGDRVIVAGFQANPYRWMAAADLLVLCSDHEGLPNVLVESLICGTPVISTDCPSGPAEILGALPEALVPCGDAATLAERMAHFLATPPDIGVIDLERYSAARAIDAYEALGRRQTEMG